MPTSILKVLSQNNLIEREFNLSPQQDASGLGVSMKWLTPAEQIEEAFQCYPGISALDLNFIPIGMCLEGSGDPYFVKSESEVLKVFRIPHESVIGEDIDESQIEYVCFRDELLIKG